MSDLPDEITEEILVRLPAISLLRFNLVCKQWRSLISNPNFVRKHLNHVLLLEDLDQKSNSNQHHNKFIIYSNPEFYSVDCCYVEESLHSISTTMRHFPLPSPLGVAILGSCNGLLLIGFYGKNFNYDALLLWNPSLRDYNILPQRSSISWGHIRLLGFGYDSSLEDYKVVALVVNSIHALPMRDVQQKVEIYTLRTNSWKTIRGGIPYGNVSIGQLQGTLVGGSIYWLVTDADYEDEEVYDNLILAFDLIDENFRLFGVPRDDDGDSTLGGSLVEARGCLGFYQTQYSSGDVMIWILKEDVNNTEYWTKLMRIPKDIYMHSQPAFFMKNDEVLLTTNDEFLGGDKKLVVYNPRNATFRNLPACGISDWWDEIIYVETLVSPNDIGRSLLEE
ncbi:hypothetical protein LguiA_001160 [Lonicera macranthoides]